MAKAKKKDALSLEEKLERALVPVDEQPYEVPENWCWLYLGALLTEIKNGTTIKQDKSEEGYSVTRIESLQNQTIDFNRLGTIVDSNTIKEADWYQAGDIAMSHINSAEHVGKTAMITEDMLPLVHGMNLLRLRFNKCCLPRYFQYFTQSYQYKDEILKRINMAVNQVSINQKQVGTLEFPLPPLAEQQRIAEQIESLFVKLDEAKDKVLDVITSSQCRKDSLLHKAFEGVLTCRWRDKNNVVLENKYYSFDECIQKMQNGLAKRSGSKGKEFAVIRLANLSTDGFVTEDLRMILLDEKEQENYRLYADDVLMIRVNGSKDNVARQICVDSDTEWAFCDHIIRIKYDKAKVLPRFMVYFSKSQYYRNYIADNMVSSAGQNTISRKGMSNLTVPNFMLEEQEEIIKILDKLWKSEDEIQIKAEQVVEQIDLMKKSILAKAFRGELGTNNPDEESAVELLKKIITEE